MFASSINLELTREWAYEAREHHGIAADADTLALLRWELADDKRPSFRICWRHMQCGVASEREPEEISVGPRPLIEPRIGSETAQQAVGARFQTNREGSSLHDASAFVGLE